MDFYKKIKEILFEKDLMAFIKRETSNKTDEEREDVFAGAWIENNVSNWSIFKSEQSDDASKILTIKEEKNIDPKDLLNFLGTKSLEEKSPITEGNAILDDIAITDKSKTAGRKIKVFFVEDNKTVQLAIKTLLNAYSEVKLTGSASNGQEAIDKIKSMSSQPDVILMDIAMPRMNGIEATKEILKFYPSIKIIMLTAYGTKQYIIDAFGAGAIGYIRKDGGLNLIREAINQAASGGVMPLQDEVAVHLLEGVKSPTEKTEDDDEIVLMDAPEEESPAEEIEMTEEEFIEELKEELLEEILSMEKNDMYEENLTKLLKTETIKELAQKFILQFSEDTFPEESTKKSLIEKLEGALQSSLEEELLKLKKTS
ncbi:MAG TPA: response regulator transcription factor [Candidatus Eremiobacteraeota bacterium]|nr:MAG: Response regulator protein VraR [bacterium ADurb.Bin363]HPZ06763.1 response regulator transcription factor [Candidatus Eremiobacteraeota bacterium]